MKFKINRNASPVGTSLRGEVNASYSDLVEVLGDCLPETPDGYKISTEWVFESENGEVVTLYDYKETNLYDERYPSVKQFRKLKSYDWHIGAMSEDIAASFRDWLLDKISKIKKKEDPNKSREYTEDEVKEKFLQTVENIVDYWVNISKNPSVVRKTAEGVAFSILSMLDGCSGNICGFVVAPLPAEEDKEYLIENGENYYPENHDSDIKCDIAGGLHEQVFQDRR